MDSVISYINSNKQRYIEELIEYLKIPSISTNEENKPDMQNCAKFTAEKLKEAGLKNVKVFQTAGHPIVYGDWLGAEGKPTVLIYGHYDVQPVDPLDLWTSPPFEPVIKNNKIYARGATDDKGQLYVHIKSVEAFLKQKKGLPVNVKFLLEGEEEVGSVNLGTFINKNKKLLSCDTVLISDTSLYDKGIPTLTYGLRGLCYLEVEITGPNKDLHSGSYGGAVANPVNVLIDIIAGLHNKDGKIAIPKFYDDVVKLTPKERENFKKLNFSEKKLMAEVGVKELFGEKGYSALERIWSRPTLDVNGIWGGFTGKGAKTIIPSVATAKISMRLVPNQDPQKIAKLVSDYLKSIAPKSVKIKVTNLHGGNPVMTPIDHKATKAGARAMERAFKKETVFIKEGGSIPVIAKFSSELKAPSVMMGLGLNSENLHSPNEHFDLNHFHLGILSSAYFMDEFSK